MRMQPMVTLLLLLVAATGSAQTTTQTTPNTTPTMPNTTSTQNPPTTQNTTKPQNKTNTQTPKNPKGAAAGGQRSDFALFDGTNPQTLEFGAQCGATLGGSQAVAFTYHVTVSNWSDTVRILRVLYADGEEMARYQIPPHTSFSFSQAAGGTAGVDDLIRVFGEGAAPVELAGSMSATFPAAAKPHPSIGQDFCATLTTQPTS
jgi:hypothetical protein